MHGPVTLNGTLEATRFKIAEMPHCLKIAGNGHTLITNDLLF